MRNPDIKKADKDRQALKRLAAILNSGSNEKNWDRIELTYSMKEKPKKE